MGVIFGRFTVFNTGVYTTWYLRRQARLTAQQYNVTIDSHPPQNARV